MDRYISLDYGNGGKKTAELIEEMFVPAFANDTLSELSDGAVIPDFGLNGDGIVFSTDSFVVDPRFFPGGDIGKLCVCGTVNDISMAGAVPEFLSLALIIEEGLDTEELRSIIESIKKTAQLAGVKIVTGDTKVVEHGKGDGIYINTAGIGRLKLPGLSAKKMKDGDKVLISGTAGDHGVAVMLARNPKLLQGEVISDCALMHRIAGSLMELGEKLRVMRDPTRGGVATTLCEFIHGTAFNIELDEKSIPLDPKVKSACDILGLDPLYCACEGKLLAVVDSAAAEEALTMIRAFPEGRNAAIIGTVHDTSQSAAAGRVTLKTAIGGRRILTPLSGDMLPRIC